jgi:hypothetical protein
MNLEPDTPALVEVVDLQELAHGEALTLRARVSGLQGSSIASGRKVSATS